MRALVQRVSHASVTIDGVVHGKIGQGFLVLLGITDGDTEDDAVYLADKTGQLISTTPAQRYETLAWVFFQVSGVGPTFGQLGFFLRFAGKDYEDKRPRQRFVDESRRLLGVLDHRLEGREWIVDDYSIADIATFGWVNALVEFYAAGDILGLSSYSNVQAWLERGLARPA